MYPGVHSVRYVASDAAGNRAECHFSIHVRGKFMLLCPSSIPPETEKVTHSQFYAVSIFL